MIVGVVALMGVGGIVGFFVDAAERGQLREFRSAIGDARAFQQALADIETGCAASRSVSAPNILNRMPTG